MINKHAALRDWVQDFCTNENGQYLYFENIEMYPSARAIIPQYGDYIVKKDVTGNQYKQYTFAFVGVQTFDTGTSEINVENMLVFDKFNAWILEQQNKKNFPDFGEKASNFELTPLQNMANMALYDNDTNTAKYMLAVKIDYEERED